jgi:hypothetical protein
MPIVATGAKFQKQVDDHRGDTALLCSDLCMYGE